MENCRPQEGMRKPWPASIESNDARFFCRREQSLTQSKERPRNSRAIDLVAHRKNEKRKPCRIRKSCDLHLPLVWAIGQRKWIIIDETVAAQTLDTCYRQFLKRRRITL